jgi:hypothetical protein
VTRKCRRAVSGLAVCIVDQDQIGVDPLSQSNRRALDGHSGHHERAPLRVPQILTAIFPEILAALS